MSLQQMTLVKIATRLWTKVYIINSITDLEFPQNYLHSEKKWQELKDKVVEKASHLPLAEILKKDLFRLIGYFGREIEAWHAQCEFLISSNQLIWTSRGTIDRKETAKMLVKDKNNDVEARYKLACIYCLEEEMPELWKQFPKLQKAYFCLGKAASNTKAHKYVRFWSCHLVGKMSMLEKVILKHTGQSNPHVYALQLAAYDGNLAATQFFFSKLSDEEKNTLLVKCAVKVAENAVDRSYSEVFHFLFTQMSEDQQVQTLTTSTINSFQCFLVFPFQFFFIASAKLIAHLIEEYYHVMILDSIIQKIIKGWTDFNYRQLCLDYWRLIPPVYHAGELFELLMCEKDGILRSILKHADSSEKEKLMLDDLN